MWCTVNKSRPGYSQEIEINRQWLETNKNAEGNGKLNNIHEENKKLQERHWKTERIKQKFSKWKFYY